MGKKLSRNRELNSCLWSPKVIRASQSLYQLATSSDRSKRVRGLYIYTIVYYTCITCISHHTMGRSCSVKKYSVRCP